MTPLPDVEHAVLDPATLRQLVADLSAHAAIDAVIVKGAPEAYAAEHVDLHAAVALLERRAVRGVQVRYRYAGGAWTDTLLWGEHELRIVRMRLPEQVAGT